MVVLISLTVVLLVALAEKLHWNRCKRLARLSFGPDARPKPVALISSYVKAIAAGLLVYGLISLWQINTVKPKNNFSKDKKKHLVIALDVSPSMNIFDGGMNGDISRATRARDAMRSVLERIDTGKILVSVVAFYTKSRPVVIDTSDMNVISNILNDLPLEIAFDVGKTNVYSSLESAAKIGEKWPEDSAALIIVSDGDTLPETKIPKLPAAYGKKIIAGVGHTMKGTFIDNHSSRQDEVELSRLASKIGGEYLNCNEKNIPTNALPNWPVAREQILSEKKSGSSYIPILCIMISSVAIFLVSPILALWGSNWPPKLKHTVRGLEN